MRNKGLNRLATFLCMTSMIVSGAAVAGTWGTASTVSGIYMFGNSTWVYVKVSTMQNPEGCASGNSFAMLDTSQTRYKDMYALLLAAKAEGSTVSILYDGCSGGGTSGYPKVGGIATPDIW
jgi:hypothetical protein